MAYSEKLLEHFKHPQNVGTLNQADKNVGTGLVGAPECGDVMRLHRSFPALLPYIWSNKHHVH